MKKAIIWLVPALFCVLGAASTYAAEIAPDLQDYWSKAAPTDRVNAIFYLWERVDIREMDNTLHDMRATRQQRHQIVVEELQRVARETQPPLLSELENLKNQGLLDGYTPYWITNCIVVKGALSTLEEFAKNSAIERVESVPKIELIEPVREDREVRQALDSRTSGVNAVHAPQVWYELGFTGEGTLVANMDTGVDGTHPALASRWRGNHAPHEECWLDVLGTNFDTPHAAGSHGTHTMGTMCGTGSATSNVDTVGVAPGAEWIAMNAIGGFGADFDSDVLEGYQWFADPDDDPETVDDVPDVIQNSWGVYGGFPGYSDCYEVWNEAILACEAAGTVVTFSAGNEGPNLYSHRSPANIAIDSVTFFSIGSVNANNWPGTPHPISGFSSRGPSDCDSSAIKPEVVAPGEDVYSTLPGNTYGNNSGTSMAGPHVAGIIALMREANPNADPRDIKSALLETAIDYGSAGEDNTYGRGMVDAYEAVLLIASSRGLIMGQVTDATTSEPISGARIQVGDNFARLTDSQGNYRISTPSDSVLPISASAFGYAQYNSSITVAEGDTLFLDVELSPVVTGTLHGTVQIGENIPLEHAIVTPQFIPVDPEETDENGEFTFVLPGANNYTFHLQFGELETDTTLWVEAGTTTNVDVQFSTPRSQPLAGSDSSYGYVAYDRYDFGLPAQYDWTDMTDATELDYPQITDASMYIEMPFPFMYYGDRFDSLTINENGWIAGGESPLRTNSNTTIPSEQGPAAMLALCWDNLILRTVPEESRVLTKYDPAGGVFTIEYNHLYFVPVSGAYFTGQIKIFDQEVWPTPTGDCEILFLYDSVGVTTSMTVGIESPDQTDGLQVVFNALLNENSFPVTYGSAILFTTRSGERTRGNMTGSLSLHPALSEAVPNGVRLGNVQAQVFVDGSFAFPNTFAGPRTVRVQVPGYEQVITYGTVPTGGTVNVEADVLRLDPPSNLTYTRSNDSLFMTWELPESVGGLDDLQSYIIHIDSYYLDETSDLFYNARIPTGEQGHFFWLTASYEGGESGATDTIFVTWLGADESVTIPSEFALSPAFPNPFNPTTSMDVALPQNSHVSLHIYDVTGRIAATIADGDFSAGVHRFTWNAAGMATGVYFARVESSLGTQMQKLLLLK